MFLDLSGQKLLLVCGLVVAIFGSIAIFVLANTFWNILPQISYEFSRDESGLLYWFEYELPGTPGASVVAATTPSGDAQSIPVLLYHGEGGSSANMPLSTFVNEMTTLKENGWHTVTIEQFEEWEEGKIQLPAKSFLLTFDDGRKDTYYEADPVLQEMGFTAVMFVITGFSLPPDGKSSDFYLNQTELANMVASGRWELESHGDEDHSLYAVYPTTDTTDASTTSGHFLSNKFFDASTNTFETNAQFTERVQGDMENSVNTLEKDFGITVNAFAYPFNDFGQDSVNFPGSQAILDQVLPQIYAYTFYQAWPQVGDTFNYPLTNNGVGSTPYMIKRIEPGLNWSGQELLAALNAGSAKPLPYQTSSFGEEWIQAWGNATPTSQGLQLSAATSTSGADTVLNGSGWWSNYYFSATIDWQVGADISLLARYTANEDYLACAFTADEVAVEWHTADSQVTYARADLAFPDPSSNAQIGMSVNGESGTCYVNGTPIVSAVVPPMASHGSIGVEVWDPQNGVAEAIVKSVSAEASGSVAPVIPVATPAVSTPNASTTSNSSVPTTVSSTAPAQEEPAPTEATSSAATSSSNFFSRMRSFMNPHPSMNLPGG